MSRYITNSLKNNINTHTVNSSNKKTITIATAQQAPLIAKTDTERDETASIVVANFGGGVSFSLEKTFDQALINKDINIADKCLITIVEQLSIFGTCDTRIDINSTKLTETSRNTFYKLCLYNIDLVITTIKDIYLTGRSPKVSHSIYLLALLTSVTREDSVTESTLIIIRSKAYDLVPMFRTATHLFEWINTHIHLCSLHAKGIKDSGMFNTNGLILSPLFSLENKADPMVRNKSVNSSVKGKASKKENKLARAGGTGAGFRRAVESWYLSRCETPESAKSLAIQIVKYNNRNGFTHNDVLSLVHIKMTDKKKCRCRTKIDCECRVLKSCELKNIISVASQIPLAYAVNGLEHATKILIDGVERLIYNGGDPEIDNDIYHAMNIFAFLCAVDEAKNESTDTNRVCDLIRLFRLTREMVSNTKLNDSKVFFNLTFKYPFDKPELIRTQADLLKTHLPLHSLIDAHFPLPENNVDPDFGQRLSEISVGMPITALVRNLNNLTCSGLFDQTHNTNTNTNSVSLINLIAGHLTNHEVLRKGFVHPINLFNAWAVYSRGKGHLGSKTWKPIESINKSLLEAVELSFQGLNGLDMSVAFLMDASGSMSCEGSAPGMPCLKALDIAVLLVLTFYRATSNYAAMYGKSMPTHLIGYFGGGSVNRYRSNTNNAIDKINTNNAIDKIISDTELAYRASAFKDVSTKFSPTMTFKDAKEALGNGIHLGVTDISAALWSLIGKLKCSLENVKSNNLMSTGITVFQLTGFAELLMLITDNDVNSGDQPMDVLQLYWGLVSQAFQILPFDKDGSISDPVKLFAKYVPRLVVIATQGTQVIIGDPRDSRILNISGFDASAPALIDAFVRKGVKNTSRTDNDDIVGDIDE